MSTPLMFAVAVAVLFIAYRLFKAYFGRINVIEVKNLQTKKTEDKSKFWHGFQCHIMLGSNDYFFSCVFESTRKFNEDEIRVILYSHVNVQRFRKNVKEMMSRDESIDGFAIEVNVKDELIELSFQKSLYY